MRTERREFSIWRVFVAGVVGSFAGAVALSISMSSAVHISQDGPFDAFPTIWLFSAPAIILITALVDVVASIGRPTRSVWALLGALITALALSFPFWPPELTGQPPVEFPTDGSVFVFALVTAVVWWRLLPLGPRSHKEAE